MKHPIQFRFDEKTVGALQQIASMLGCSKTAAAEQAIEHFAHALPKRKKANDALLSMAGSLPVDIADTMLQAVYEERAKPWDSA